MRRSHPPESIPTGTHGSGYTLHHRDTQTQVTTEISMETGYTPAKQVHSSHTVPGAGTPGDITTVMGPHHYGNPGQSWVHMESVSSNGIVVNA